jgi:hypothetical protein
MKNDILNSHLSELRKMPFRVPEGYFEGLQDSLRIDETHAPAEARSFLGRMAPYASMAAAFAIMVTAGTAILKNVTEKSDMTYEDYIVHSEIMIIDEEETENTYQEADAQDIVEYLIHSGITAELIEFTK